MTLNSYPRFFDGFIHARIYLSGFFGSTVIIYTQYPVVIINSTTIQRTYTTFKAFITIPVNIVMCGKSMINPSGNGVFLYRTGI